MCAGDGFDVVYITGIGGHPGGLTTVVYCGSANLETILYKNDLQMFMRHDGRPIVSSSSPAPLNPDSPEASRLTSWHGCRLFSWNAWAVEVINASRPSFNPWLRPWAILSTIKSDPMTPDAGELRCCRGFRRGKELDRQKKTCLSWKVTICVLPLSSVIAPLLCRD